jgi:hypothetical protein
MGRRQLIRAWPHGQSGARELADGGATEKGEHGAHAVVERRRDGGDERHGLELDTRATKSVRELKRERKKGGECQGCSLPFIGLGGRQRWPG